MAVYVLAFCLHLYSIGYVYVCISALVYVSLRLALTGYVKLGVA